MIQDEKQITAPQRKRHSHVAWRGAIRGEYNVAAETWSFFCPIWHGGQAIKALVMASSILRRPDLLDKARTMAGFLLANSIALTETETLILAYEDHPDKINISAILESLDGLLLLSEATNQAVYQEVALNALRWIRTHAYIAGEGLFHDLYDAEKKIFIPNAYGTFGRPLLDDGMFLKGYRISREESFLQIATETADRLLQEENPAGNWIRFAPCLQAEGKIHPRHAYWWGLPMLEMYRHTKNEKYRAIFLRSMEWYKKALRKDGGIFRGTYTDFTTDSFGHATSGSACAVIMFIEYLKETGDQTIIPYIEKGLQFCEKMQMLTPEDPNLTGVVLEKVLEPDGTDRSPYYVRDLGTIFYIQAVCQWLRYITPSVHESQSPSSRCHL